MATPIIMPKFGQMTEDSAIVEWLKKEGDSVAKGDILFTVETDKSVMDVESFEEGTLLKIVVPPKVSVPVQTVVGFLGKPGEALAGAAAPAAVPPPAPAEAGRAGPVSSPSPASLATAPALFRISPRAAALARRSGIDPAAIPGSGPSGRVIERDVKQYLETRGGGPLRAGPAAGEPARETSAGLPGGGPGAGGHAPLSAAPGEMTEQPVAMSRMRQVIAMRLTQSFRDTPHFYVTVSADMTGLIAYRNELKAAGAPCTITDFISQSVVLSLLEFPTVNSSTDGMSTRWHAQVNLGLAVSIQGGLVVPVIHNAGALRLRELSAASKRLGDKARAGKLTPDEMTGGTFTISNMGMLNVENFSAIINPGEGAILAVASAMPQPVVRAGKVDIGQIMKMTLSVDHRLIDGAQGAQFLNAVKAKLENMELWKRLTS
jgi:pyruvate dehydrogenase E2 component (dihydrolipoamide acetyltransferase)